MDYAPFVNRLELAGLLCWLLKDLGWALLCAQLAWPAAIAALLLETASLRLRWGTARTSRLVHGVVVVVWLLGNVVWLFSELLFLPSTERGRQFPWYHGPLATADNNKYAKGLWAARLLFALGLSVLLLFYVFRAARHRSAKREPPQEDLVFGMVPPDVYELVFIGPWILKDFFWTLDLLWWGMPFAIVAAMLITDCFRRFRHYAFLAEFLWVLANAVWMYGELALDDSFQANRVVAGALLLAGLGVTVFDEVSARWWAMEPVTEASRLLPPSKGI